MKRPLLYTFLMLAPFFGIGASVSGVDHGRVETNVAPNWDVKIYPNPNNGIFSLMVTGSSSQLSVVVFNVIGEKVFQLKVLGDHGAKIDLSGLQKGLYVVQVLNEQKGEIITRRMHLQ